MTPRLSPPPGDQIHVCSGAALPPLLHHHPHPRSHALTRRWRPTTMNPVYNKPSGGIWAAPATPRKGVWQPVPRWSSWRDRCERVDDAARVRWQTRLYPDPRALFLVVDSEADARALYAAFPHCDPPTEHLERAGLGRLRVDWARALGERFAGVWLTERGERVLRRLPRGSQTPGFDGWDVPTVFFGRRALRAGVARRAPRMPEFGAVNEAALRKALAEVKAEFARAGEEPPVWLSRLL